MSERNKFITDKISPSLLTPIRRVGLSRIRKSNSLVANTHSSTLSQNENKLITDKISPSLLTPIARVGLSKIRKSNSLVTNTQILSKSSQNDTNVNVSDRKTQMTEKGLEFSSDKNLSTNSLFKISDNIDYKMKKDKSGKEWKSAKKSTEKEITLNNSKCVKKKIRRISSDEGSDENNFSIENQMMEHEKVESTKLKTKEKTEKHVKSKTDEIENDFCAKKALSKNILNDSKKNEKVEENVNKTEMAKKDIRLKNKHSKKNKRRISSDEESDENNFSIEDQMMEQEKVKTTKVKTKEKSEKDVKSNLNGSKKDEKLQNNLLIKTVEGNVNKNKRRISSDEEEIANIKGKSEEELFEEEFKAKKKKIEMTKNDKILESEENDFCIKKSMSSRKAKSEMNIKKDENVNRTVKAPENKEKATTLKRCLSLKKFSSVDRESPLSSSQKSDQSDGSLKTCSVHLERVSPLQFTASADEEQVANLEKQVREKRELLEALKRAEIYRNLHNPQDLEQLRQWWKTGCISALNDLLPQVQDYSKMGMGELLSNLGIPPNLVAVSQNGDLE